MFAAREVGSDVGGESFIPREPGYQDEAASDGAVFCQREVAWFRLGAEEDALVGTDPGILIAAIQNIEVLIRYGEKPKKTLMVRLNQVEAIIKVVIQPICRMTPPAVTLPGE